MMQSPFIINTDINNTKMMQANYLNTPNPTPNPSSDTNALSPFLVQSPLSANLNSTCASIMGSPLLPNMITPITPYPYVYQNGLNDASLASPAIYSPVAGTCASDVDPVTLALLGYQSPLLTNSGSVDMNNMNGMENCFEFKVPFGSDAINNIVNNEEFESEIFDHTTILDDINDDLININEDDRSDFPTFNIPQENDGSVFPLPEYDIFPCNNGASSFDATSTIINDNTLNLNETIDNEFNIEYNNDNNNDVNDNNDNNDNIENNINNTTIDDLFDNNTINDTINDIINDTINTTTFNTTSDTSSSTSTTPTTTTTSTTGSSTCEEENQNDKKEEIINTNEKNTLTFSYPPVKRTTKKRRTNTKRTVKRMNVLKFIKTSEEAEAAREYLKEMQIKRDAEIKARMEAQARAKMEAANERVRREYLHKMKMEALMKAKKQALAKAKMEAMAKARMEAKIKAKMEAKLRAKREAQLKARMMAELKAQKAAEARLFKESMLEMAFETSTKSNLNDLEDKFNQMKYKLSFNK